MTPDYSHLFKNWHVGIADAPTDGTIFMGRIKGTNRGIAVKFDTLQNYFVIASYENAKGPAVEICQWISFIDFADIRACAWRGV